MQNNQQPNLVKHILGQQQLILLLQQSLAAVNKDIEYARRGRDTQLRNPIDECTWCQRWFVWDKDRPKVAMWPCKLNNYSCHFQCSHCAGRECLCSSSGPTIPMCPVVQPNSEVTDTHFSTALAQQFLIDILKQSLEERKEKRHQLYSEMTRSRLLLCPLCEQWEDYYESERLVCEECGFSPLVCHSCIIHLGEECKLCSRATWLCKLHHKAHDAQATSLYQ